MTDGGRRGALVALEGIDGAGKSSLQRRLARRLRQRGWRVALWREPVSASLGRRAQRLGPADPLGSAIGFTIDRMLGRAELERRLRRHDLVLSDRSYFSTLAYQGSALPTAARRSLESLQRSVTVVPNRVLLLDLPPVVSLDRVARRGRRRAPLERRRTLVRVATRYRALARSPRWSTLDATLPAEEIARQAERLLDPWLRRRAAAAQRRGG